MIENLTCKFCGSTNLRKAGIYLSPNGDKQKVQCKDCRRVFNAYIIEDKQKEVD